MLDETTVLLTDVVRSAAHPLTGAVAVEADWPDAYRVNRYVRGAGADADAEEALKGFKRFPSWMWGNSDVLDFVGWLRTYNDDLPANAPRVGFYGLDLYSLHASIEAVLTYLDKVDPEAASRAPATHASTTSTRRVRSSRWSARPAGRRAKPTGV